MQERRLTGTATWARGLWARTSVRVGAQSYDIPDVVVWATEPGAGRGVDAHATRR